MKKIAVVTGSRAEYGLLKPLLYKIKNDKECLLQLIVTGMHLSYEFGLTYKEIESDGFFIDDKVEINLSSDSKTSICKSIGLGVIGFSDTLNRLSPDILVVLGDRYEINAICLAATVHNIPIAHIHGGETTQGAIDEALRHSITKMSYIHFTSTETYRNRVIQLGENPNRVFNVGALGVENIKSINLLSRESLENNINFELNTKYVLLTYHSETLDLGSNDTYNNFTAIISSIDKFPDLKIIFTKSNSDTNGRIINILIDEYVAKNKHKAISFFSMGQLNYLSAMKYCSFVIGNSSSGIIEAPSFKIPTINIGDRQKGRVCAHSVINTNYEKNNIISSINKALSSSFTTYISSVTNPYEKDNTSYNILSIIKDFLSDKKIDLKKEFYDI